jgi:predicted DNA-binding protein
MIKRTSKMTELVAVRMRPELRERIDEWSAKLRPIPSQGAAIRQLVEDALEAHEKGDKLKVRKS